MDQRQHGYPFRALPRNMRAMLEHVIFNLIDAYYMTQRILLYDNNYHFLTNNISIQTEARRSNGHIIRPVFRARDYPGGHQAGRLWAMFAHDRENEHGRDEAVRPPGAFEEYRFVDWFVYVGITYRNLRSALTNRLMPLDPEYAMEGVAVVCGLHIFGRDGIREVRSPLVIVHTEAEWDAFVADHLRPMMDRADEEEARLRV